MATPKEQKLRLIPCDKDCYHQQQGYCALDEITYLTSCEGNGCGYFTRTDPYADEGYEQKSPPLFYSNLTND